MAEISTCIFDAYGTLFDIQAAARGAADEPGREAFGAHWQEVAGIWRDKQLQYSFLRQITGAYVPFWEITTDALDYALESAGLDDAELRERLLQLYWELDAYPEVAEVLARLKADGLTTAILSNGSSDMLKGSVDAAGIGDSLDAILSVEEAQAFKPAAEVYELVGARFGTNEREVLFVSSNGWDIAGAAAYGFRTAWVNRGGDPVDRMPGRPDHVADDLTAIPDLAAA